MLANAWFRASVGHMLKFLNLGSSRVQICNLGRWDSDKSKSKYLYILFTICNLTFRMSFILSTSFSNVSCMEIVSLCTVLTYVILGIWRPLIILWSWDITRIRWVRHRSWTWTETYSFEQDTWQTWCHSETSCLPWKERLGYLLYDLLFFIMNNR